MIKKTEKIARRKGVKREKIFDNQQNEQKRLFQNVTFTVSENQSLDQPSPYRVIHTVTTYGAYEDPI